jgi:HEPN domain-containing protein
MTDRKLIFLLVRNGIATQMSQPNKYTEANEDTEVRTMGNAAIANALEFLGGHGSVIDVQPTFSHRGIGFTYRIEPRLVEELVDDELISRYVAGLFEPLMTDTSSAIAELVANCEKGNINIVYRDDLLASLRELEVCFSHECYIACLALSGKILEICLKQVMLDNNIKYEERWMIGQLLQKLRDAAIDKYLDQSLPEIATIINKSRIPAVHAKEKIPVPSRDQAIMVIHAVADTVNRTLICP